MASRNRISILIEAKDEASRTLRATADSFEQTADRLNRVGEGMANVGGGMTRSLTLPLGAAGAASLKMAGDFEQSLNILRSVTGATNDQMTALQQTARDLGNDVSLPGISAKDAAGAMTELAKAGLSVNDVLGASKGVLSLAKAGQIDVAAAAMTTARALNAFGLEGNQANRIADLLAAAANASTSSVEDMAYGLQMAGAQSHAMGVSLQDTVTALAIFSNAGINGSDAGTSLKTMFMALANPTKESAKLMQQLSLDFFDARGNFVGLASTAEQLNTRLSSLTQEQRNAALATLFGSDATRVATILAANGASAFNKMSEAVNKQGAATELAAAQNSGFNGALDALQSTAETALTDIGTNLLPMVTRQLKSLTDMVSGTAAWFNSLSTGQQDFIFKTVALVAAVGPAILIVGKFTTAIGSIVTVSTAAAGALGLINTAGLIAGAGAGTAALGPAGLAGGAARATGALAGGGGLLAALGPIGVALGATALAAGGAWFAYQKFKEKADDATLATQGMYAPVSLLTLAEHRLADANVSVTRTSDAYSLATRNLVAAQQASTGAQDAAKAAANRVDEAQRGVNAALAQYGSTSPQYQAAVTALHTAQDGLNAALWDTANKNLAVSTASTDVSQKLDLQSAAVGRAQAAQEALNQALHGGVNAIASFGPTAAAQVGAIGSLQVSIGSVVHAWNGWNGQLQSQLPNQTKLLQGLGSDINRVQGQGSNLVNTLQSASQLQVSTGGGLQGGAANLQGGRRAIGTNYAPGGRTLVGEHGPEYVDLPRGSKVHTAEESRGMGASSPVTYIYGNITLTTPAAVDRFAQRLGMGQELVGMGMAV